MPICFLNKVRDMPWLGANKTCTDAIALSKHNYMCTIMSQKVNKQVNIFP